MARAQGFVRKSQCQIRGLKSLVGDDWPPWLSAGARCGLRAFVELPTNQRDKANTGGHCQGPHVKRPRSVCMSSTTCLGFHHTLILNHLKLF
jgi:hypothetical protein